MFIVFKTLLFLLLLTSCSPSSLDEYAIEGESLSRSLTHELETIHSREDLIKKKIPLKKYFMSLANTAIRARKFQEKHSILPNNSDLSSEFLWSHRLKEQLIRIYQLDGGQELIESYQKEALEKLDLFEKVNQSSH